MKSYYIFPMLFALFTCSSLEEDCDIIIEIYKVSTKLMRLFERDTVKSQLSIHDGCLKAIFLGEVENCHQNKFKLPAAPICEEFIQHVDFKTNLKKHNLLKYKSNIEGIIHSNDGDADDICENLPADGEKMLKKFKDILDNPDKAKLYEKFCKKDPRGCEELKEIPKEVEDYLLKDLSPAFKDMVKIFKSKLIARLTSTPVTKVAGQIVGFIVGGGDFGIMASKCVIDIIKLVTKFIKN